MPRLGRCCRRVKVEEKKHHHHHHHHHHRKDCCEPVCCCPESRVYVGYAMMMPGYMPDPRCGIPVYGINPMGCDD